MSEGIAKALQSTKPDPGSVWPLVRIYRGGFLLIEFLFLLGINTYGWRQAGVNHVLIFELNPRNNLSHQHLFEVSLRLQGQPGGQRQRGVKHRRTCRYRKTITNTGVS